MAELTARHLHALGIESAAYHLRTFDHAVALARSSAALRSRLKIIIPTCRLPIFVIGSLVGDATDARGRRFRVRPARTPLPSDVPHRHGRAAKLRRAAERDGERLSLRHRRSRRGRDKSLGRAGARSRQGRKIVVDALDSFMRWMDGLDMVPTIKDIRVSIEQLRDRNWPPSRMAGTMEPAERQRIEALTRSWSTSCSIVSWPACAAPAPARPTPSMPPISRAACSAATWWPRDLRWAAESPPSISRSTSTTTAKTTISDRARYLTGDLAGYLAGRE